ncbi:MAG: crossover junction endodeoxyribonuclease RuvC [Parachlamydia sp.]|nr:crossover junction endodeoxyribonuclease RuvC [Parachlamydia sp.]
MIILGIDPGTQTTGYGIIRLNRGRSQAIDFGCIKSPSKLKITDRYLIIFEGVEELIARYEPDVLVVETQYVKVNVQSAIKLGMARGVCLIAAKRRGLKVFEYSPSRAKRAVVGNGRASKSQVQHMVQHLLELDALPEPEDASDALSLALCHAHAHNFNSLCGVEI